MWSRAADKSETTAKGELGHRQELREVTKDKDNAV